MFITILLLIGLTIPCYAYELPDTGQTTCYDEVGTVIACPAPGAALAQDGSYNPAATQPNYTDNGDGTTTDTRTGLMWLKDGNYPFNGVTSTGTWEQALGYCENLVYAGYSDWRLPNIRELESIVNCGTVSPAINTTYFPNTISDRYWTSTTYVPSTVSTWVVGFDNGFVSYRYKQPNAGYVRCVRTGP